MFIAGLSRFIGAGRCGFQPHRTQSNPVGAVFNRTGLDYLINSKIHYSASLHLAPEGRHVYSRVVPIYRGR